MEDVPIPHIGESGAPDRARDQCQPSALFAWVFGRAHLHRCGALDGPGHDAGRDWKCVFRSGRRPGWDTSMCVRACVFVCSSVLRVHVQLCLVSPASPGFFRAQSRSGWIAELWNRIKLHCKTFHTQPQLQRLTWEMIRVGQQPPKLRAKGAETRHLVPSCFELAMDFHKHQPHCPWTLRAAVRLAHDHVCGAV